MTAPPRPRRDLSRTLSGLPPDRLREVEVARAAAEEAGTELSALFGRVSAERKADGTLVTEADAAADALITRRLRVAFPGDELLGEESGTRYHGGRRVWVFDPLDGTTNYASGVPVWGVTLALVEGGRPVLGVSLFPQLGLRFLAIRGRGAWLGEQRLATRRSIEFGAEQLIAHCSRTPRYYALDVEARRRVLGSSALNFALVASGTFRGAVCATPRLWDLAAGWLLVEEAGGTVHPLDGDSPWPLAMRDYEGQGFPTLVAGSPEIHDALRERVRAREGRIDAAAPAGVVPPIEGPSPLEG